MARATATATKRSPQAAPSARRPERPDLAVVGRARLFTPTSVLVTALAVTLAFCALSVQISLIHRQQRLDEVRSEITAVQASNKELRQRESRLQAPAEILRIARDDLGMVESKPPELVTPATEIVGATPTAATPSSLTPVAATPAASSASPSAS